MDPGDRIEFPIQQVRKVEPHHRMPRDLLQEVPVIPEGVPHEDIVVVGHSHRFRRQHLRPIAHDEDLRQRKRHALPEDVRLEIRRPLGQPLGQSQHPMPPRPRLHIRVELGDVVRVLQPFRNGPMQARFTAELVLQPTLKTQLHHLLDVFRNLIRVQRIIGTGSERRLQQEPRGRLDRRSRALRFVPQDQLCRRLRSNRISRTIRQGQRHRFIGLPILGIRVWTDLHPDLTDTGRDQHRAKGIGGEINSRRGRAAQREGHRQWLDAALAPHGKDTWIRPPLGDLRVHHAHRHFIGRDQHCLHSSEVGGVLPCGVGRPGIKPNQPLLPVGESITVGVRIRDPQPVEAGIRLDVSGRHRQPDAIANLGGHGNPVADAQDTALFQPVFLPRHGQPLQPDRPVRHPQGLQPGPRRRRQWIRTRRAFSGIRHPITVRVRRSRQIPCPEGDFPYIALAVPVRVERARRAAGRNHPRHQAEHPSANIASDQTHAPSLHPAIPSWESPTASMPRKENAPRPTGDAVGGS